MVGGDADLVVVEPKTGLTRIIGTLNMNGSIAEIVMSPTSPRAAFVFAHHQSGGETAGAVARIDLTDLRLSLDAE